MINDTPSTPIASSNQNNDNQASSTVPVQVMFPKNWKHEIPEFHRNDPALWFMMCERTFRRFEITADDDKVDDICSKLGSKQLSEISDILRGNDINKYALIKDRITHIYSVSAEKLLDQLLSDKSFNTHQKPSQLLLEMRQKGGDAVTDDVLKRLWLNALPTRARDILVITEESSLDKLARIADKIYDEIPETQNKSVCPISIKPEREKPISEDQNLSSLFDMMKIMMNKICDLEKNQDTMANRSRSPNRNPGSRFRSQSRKRQELIEGVCFYHRTFGEKAYKCAPGCTKNAITTNNNTPLNPNGTSQ